MGKIDRNVFLDTFFEEAKEHINNITTGLLLLEKGQINEDLFPNIFRSAHSLKGAAALMGFLKVRDIAHKLEDVFGELRDKKIDLTPDIITSALTSLDQIKAILENRTDETEKKEEKIKPVQETAKKIVEQEKTPQKPISEEIKPIFDRRDTDRRVEERRTTSRRVEDVKNVTHEKMQSIRIAVEKLDELMNLTGELVVNKISFDEPTKNIFKNTVELENVTASYEYIKKIFKNNQHYFSIDDATEIEKSINRIENIFLPMRESFLDILNTLYESLRKFDLISNNLQESIMQCRMLPMATIFDEFHRAVRDLAIECNKEVNLIIKGSDTELDKKILEQIKDPLIHLLRNSVDHGIESPEERVKNNKIREGVIVINAFHKGSCIYIEVEDDGAGINKDLIIEKAIEKGLATKKEIARMTDQEILNFIFAAGFSTKKIITDISGRGIGMSVVKKNIGELKGILHINSVYGQGTKISIKLPLTLAIMHVLMTKCGEQTFAIPLSHIVGIERVPLSQIKTIEKRTVIDNNKQIIPLTFLQDVLKIKGKAKFNLKFDENNNIIYDTVDTKSSENTLKGKNKTTNISNYFLPTVILDSGEGKIGFVVDELLGRKEIVSKSLGNFLTKVKNVAGATIIGTGEVILILDIPSLINSARWMDKSTIETKTYKSSAAEHKKTRNVLVVDDSLTTREMEKTIIETAGYNVDIAMDGREGLEKVEKGKYDLIVTDIDMPIMDGFTFTRMVKENPKSKQIPIIIVSAKKSDEYKKKGIDAGAEAYITKSGFDQNNLLNTIESLLS